MRLSRRPLLSAAAGLAVVAGGRRAWADQFVTVLTGGTSGVFYPLGIALARLYGKRLPGVRANAQATKASVENLNLLSQGKAEVAFATGESVLAAWQGNAEAGFPQPLHRLRGLASLYTNYIHVVALADSGVRTMADLKGKVFSVGPPRSGNELTARAILGAAGLSYSDLRRVEYLPYAETVELMKNRQVDATIQSAGLGVASIRDLAASVPITIVSVPHQVVKQAGEPYYPITLPAGVYPGQEQPVETAAVGSHLITHTGVAADLVYDLTRIVFEDKEELAAAHGSGREIDIKRALLGLPIPMHDGAKRYLAEHGVG